jgi:O-antigen/teichoic acid export membrane protein
MIKRLRRKLPGLDGDLREVLRGSALGFAVKVLAAASAFCANVVVARLLGADQAGLFFLAHTIVLLAAAVGRLGLDQTFVRLIAAYRADDDWGRVKAVYRTGLTWVLLLSTGLALLLWTTADVLGRYVFSEAGFGAVLRVTALAVPFVALFGLLAAALQGVKRVVESLLTLSVIAPLALLIFALALRPETADEVALLFVVSAGIAVLGGVLSWYSRWPWSTPAQPVPSSHILASCLPLFVATVLSLSSNLSGQLMLGAWATSADVAIFNAAQRTAALTSFVLVAVNSIAAPKFAALYTTGQKAALKQTALNSTRLMVVVALPPLALMLFFPSWVLSLFGPAFPDGALALQILAIGQFVNVASGSVGYLLAMTGHERILRNIVFVAAASCIGLGLVLVPAYGLLGAAIATAVGMAMQNVLCVWQSRQLLDINTFMFLKLR